MLGQVDLTPVKRPDKMASYWKKEWIIIMIVTISGLFFNGSMSLLPVLQGKLLDVVIYDRRAGLLFRQAAFFLCAVLFIQLMRGIKRYSVRVFANRTESVMRREIYNNIMHKRFEELVREEAGDLMNKAVNDVNLCVEGMRKITTEVFDTGVLMTGYFISMSAFDIRITLSSCLFIPVAMWIASRLKVLVVKYNREARTQSSRVAQLTYSDMEHIMLYRIHGVMQFKQKEYEAELAGLEKKSVRSNVLENSTQPVYNTIAMLGIGTILYFGGQKVVTGIWTVGTFTAYITIFTSLAIKAGKASKLFNSFQKSVVSWKRLKPYYSRYEEVSQQKQQRQRAEISKGTTTGVEVSHLSFSYQGTAQDIFCDISFAGERGGLIGVTGPVAGGKTSLGMALTGAYPYQGSVKVNGFEIKELTSFQKSCLISYQGHSPQLLSDTIYENITLGVQGDISGVLKDVCFDVDLASMPEGIHTIVGSRGVRLSGGQQSRIALARALWHKAPFVILDDPFSAVDKKTEAQIVRNLKNNYGDRVFLVISHRLAAFSKFHQILYLKGKTAAVGSHKELMEKIMEYRSLFQMQEEKAEEGVNDEGQQ